MIFEPLSQKFDAHSGIIPDLFGSGYAGLGIYKALGVPAATVATLKGPRTDIIRAINLGRPIPVADGSTGDVIALDAAIDSSFPNGQRQELP